MSKKFSWALYAAAALALIAAISLSGYAAPPTESSPAMPTPVSFQLYCSRTEGNDNFCGFGHAVWTWTPEDLGLTKGQLLVIEFVTYGVYIAEGAEVSLAELAIIDYDPDGEKRTSFWLAPGDPVVEAARTTQSNGQQVRLYVDDDDKVEIYLELSISGTLVNGFASFSGYVIDDKASSLAP